MFSLGDADAAASIVQDTFLKAYNNRETFRNDCSISTWLTGIALNLVRDYHRNRRFRFWHKVGKTSIDVIESANFLPGSERPVEVQVLARERARCVAVAVESLSVRQRTVFIMRFVDDMDLSEIAQVSGMPVNTVKTHLRRALKSVKEHVRDSGL
jgi:RNA polymerase sigma-70 factor (ECF subfamily)